MGPFVLRPRERQVLQALCRSMVPHAFSREEAPSTLPAAVEARLAAAPSDLSRRVAGLLSFLGHPLAAPLLTGRRRSFLRLTAPEQEEVLRGWEGSRWQLRRTLFQALRRLILSTYYTLPEAHSAIGFRGPLHRRQPAVSWEGPLPGDLRADEPVARMPDLKSFNHRRPPSPGVGSSAAPPPGIHDGRQLAGREARIRAQVCVVGTGAGGAVVAARLAEAGYEVVMLEEGGYWTSADFTEEERGMVPRLYAEQGARSTDDLAVSILQGRCVGGGTAVNWMITLRTPDWVLEEWVEEHGAVGMGPTDLSPIFDLVEDEIHARPVPEDAHNPANLLLLEGCRILGWRGRTTRINARECVRAGSCGLGCRYGAKQSALVTYIPRALAAGARLYADVAVDHLERVERGGGAPLKRVHGRVLDRASGRPMGSLTVEAPLVVLAAGAVGTPAILARSGLAGGGVGRFLRLHPTTAVIGRYDREIYGAAGIPQSALCDEFLRGDSGYGFWIECPAFGPGLAAVAIPGFGAEHRRIMGDFPRLGTFIVLLRDGGERGRSSGEVVVDRRGRPRIRYRLAAVDRRTLRAGIVVAGRLHFAAGAREALTLHSPQRRIASPADLGRVAELPDGPHRLALFSAHVNGTCRIGTDPRRSGCTPDGERHGVPGLYVADGSLLPTAPGVNPQETIMAVATVVARRISARHRAD